MSAAVTTVQAHGGLIPVEFHNLGPLTTVFTTPAAECTAVPVATSGFAIWFQPRQMYLQVDNCDVKPYVPECHPGGEAREELVDDEYQVVPFGVYGYHSPGLHCPSGWETAGVIAMNNGTPSATGLFSPSAFTPNPETTTTSPPNDFVANMFTSVLGPTETGVACCPSGYTADPWYGCFSHFPVSELASETICTSTYTGTVTPTGTNLGMPEEIEYTFTYFGTTVTASAINVTAMRERDGPYDTSTENYSVATLTIDASGNPPEVTSDNFGFEGWIGPVGNRTGVALREPLFLVQPGNETEGEGGEDKPASAGRLVPAAWTTIGAVMAAWGVGMAAGVGLLAAW